MSEEQQGPEQFAHDTERKLRARIEQLLQDNTRLHAGWHDANVRASDAGLKLTKAVGLLAEIEERLSSISGFFFDTFPRKEIRTVLAELEGGNER